MSLLESLSPFVDFALACVVLFGSLALVMAYISWTSKKRAYTQSEGELVDRIGFFILFSVVARSAVLNESYNGIEALRLLHPELYPWCILALIAHALFFGLNLYCFRCLARLRPKPLATAKKILRANPLIALAGCILSNGLSVTDTRTVVFTPGALWGTGTLLNNVVTHYWWALVELLWSGGWLLYFTISDAVKHSPSLQGEDVPENRNGREPG